MSDLMRGKYFAFTSASVVAGDDLLARAETLSGVSDIVAKKVTIISSGSLAFDVNELGTDSVLPQYSDNINRMTIGNEDNWIKSIVIGQTSACPVTVELIF